MTSTSSSFYGRTRAAAQLGAAVLLALGVVVACSSDTTGSGPGGGGAGGKGGTASGGKAGMSHSGGDTSAGSGDMPTSGSGGKGGSDETGMAGDAGAMNSEAVCGNGKVEAGEECDDGNLKDGDGCSSTCTNKCELCEQTNCAAPGSLADVGPSFQQCYGDDSLARTPAEGGPAAGTPRNKLCQQMVACVRKTNCATNPTDPITPCLCGSASVLDCAADPKGPCAAEISAAAESRTFNDIQQRAADTTFAVGTAYTVLSACDATVCPRECIQHQAASACERCLLADKNVFDVMLRPPTVDHTLDCSLVYGECYTFSGSGALSGTCSAAVECGIRTGCAANGLESCYAGGSGPCAAEFAADAMSSDPATITALITHGGMTVVSGDALRCAVHDCRTACFPGAGGTGGTGGGGTGGTAGSSSGGGGTGGTAGSSSGGGDVGGTSSGSGGTAGVSAGSGGSGGTGG